MISDKLELVMTLKINEKYKFFSPVNMFRIKHFYLNYRRFYFDEMIKKKNILIEKEAELIRRNES